MTAPSASPSNQPYDEQGSALSAAERGEIPLQRLNIPSTEGGREEPVAGEPSVDEPTGNRGSQGPTSPTPTPPRTQTTALVIRWVDRGSIFPNLQDPRAYTPIQKGIIVAVVASCSFSAPFASNILMPSFPFIGPALRMRNSGVTLTSAMFMLALGIGPLYHAFLSQKFGRRPIYLGGFILYTFASIACALSPRGTDLVAFRFFQAFGGSAAQSVGMGTIADIYIPSERGRATGTSLQLLYYLFNLTSFNPGFWYIGTIMGPMISPLIGGALFQWQGWRAILWATAIFGGILVLLIVLLLPETSITLKAQQAAALNQRAAEPEILEKRPIWTASSILIGLFTYTIRPLLTVMHLASPQIGLPAIYASFCFGSLYAISIATPFMFARAPYRLHSIDISLLYLPACVGYAIGSVVGGYLSDAEVRKAKARDGDDYAPEVRLRSARWGIPLVPAGLLVFGWGLHRHTRLALPITGGFIFGVGVMLTNGTIMAYYADAIPGQTAPVVAAYNALRNVFAGLISAITVLALQSGLHDSWYFSLLAIVCFISSFALELLQRKGPAWREKKAARLAANQAIIPVSS